MILMPLIGAKAASLIGPLLPAVVNHPAGQPPPWFNNEEGPPHAWAVWLGIGLLIGVIAAITLGLRYQRHRRLRALSVLPDDPFAVEAMEAAVKLFCALDPAWRGRDRDRLRRLVSPSVMAGWQPQLDASPAGELWVDGPLSFEYMGAAGPAPGADRRATVRVEGRLRAASKQLAISSRQRGWLLGVAAAILVAAFVGIALAPATKIASARPATIVVRQGVPLGGTHLLTYKKGALIDLTVSSDMADEVHFHGYDIHKDVAPGHPVHFLIRATIEGSYPVELEEHAETLAQVTVEP